LIILRPLDIVNYDPAEPSNRVLFGILHEEIRRGNETLIAFNESFGYALFDYKNRILVLQTMFDDKMMPTPSNADTIRIYTNKQTALDYIERMTKAVSK